MPLNTMLEAGDASMEELIKGVDRGLYVTRFHYTNTVHPVKTLFTGMTRERSAAGACEAWKSKKKESLAPCLRKETPM